MIEQEQTIEELPANVLLDWFVNEVRRVHYDPCDSYDRMPYDRHTLEVEILRRMTQP